MQMNSALGKGILALVRDGDYAHAGEEEAIRLALDPVPKSGSQFLLDAGCGRGGTAYFVQANGWGRVTGFDIEGESVAQAQARYPEGEFTVCDVLDIARHVRRTYDVIYAFNAFYTFPDQPAALRALRSVARPEAQLVIFDYVDRGSFATTEFASLEEAARWQPLQLESLARSWNEAKWAVESIRELHAEYERWYDVLVHRFEAKQAEIIALAGEENYRHACRVYRLMLAAVRQGALGGAVIFAKAA